MSGHEQEQPPVPTTPVPKRPDEAVGDEAGPIIRIQFPYLQDQLRPVLRGGGGGEAILGTNLVTVGSSSTTMLPTGTQSANAMHQTCVCLVTGGTQYCN